MRTNLKQNTMKLIDKHCPKTYSDIVGNEKTISRIFRAVDDNDGFGGLVFMFLGRTGSGKTLLADLIAGDIDGDLYRPICTKDAETASLIDQARRDVLQQSMFSTQSVYIFDEADKLHPDNIANLKILCDTMTRRRRENKPCNVTLIFTSAKEKSQLTKVQQAHWDELQTRCITCKLEIAREEMNDYFARLTGGTLTDISLLLQVCSMRAAWEYIEDNDIPVTNL